ncbi:MAG: cysteine--tRNA ligase, partial [Ekhidna sp.]|nr:cysteine--tRNA ligase [Ekhidna sp.]
GNFISLGQMFSGDHPLLDKAYSPVTVRFLMLQAHYGSPIDFSNRALESAEVASNKLLKGLDVIKGIEQNKSGSVDVLLSQQVNEKCQECFKKMNDDFNTAEVIACLFDLLAKASTMKQQGIGLDEDSLRNMQRTYRGFLTEVLGITLVEESKSQLLPEVIDLLAEVRQGARSKKDFELSDYIRERLENLGIQMNDGSKESTYMIN